MFKNYSLAKTGLKSESVKPSRSLLSRVFTRARNSLYGRYLRRRVLKQKSLLIQQKDNYKNYKDITFIIQSFNKCSNVKNILLNLLNVQASNIILIDDGSLDRTLAVASKLLIGKNHIVLRCNDVHEVINYRRAMSMSETKYICLMQDDDIPLDTPTWIEDSFSLLERFPELAILGLREGFDFGWMDENKTELKNSKFYRKGDNISLENVYEAVSVLPAKVSISGAQLAHFNFCQFVNRAPTFINREIFLRMGGIDVNFAPYQYDDVDYCLRAWTSGLKVGIMASNFSRNVSVGGMRLFNDVGIDSKPSHFGENWSRIRQRYSNSVNSGQLQSLVVDARGALHQED